MPRERTKPPTTAVKRVDFFLQNVMTSGERRRETPKHNPDKQPRINKKVEKIDTLFYPKLVESYIVEKMEFIHVKPIYFLTGKASQKNMSTKSDKVTHLEMICLYSFFDVLHRHYMYMKKYQIITRECKK